MWNLINEELNIVAPDITLIWYQSITDFVVIPKFIPQGTLLQYFNILIQKRYTGLDPLTHDGYFGFGPKKDQLPTDVNVTFFFEYEKATIEKIKIINTTDGTDNELG